MTAAEITEDRVREIVREELEKLRDEALQRRKGAIANPLAAAAARSAQLGPVTAMATKSDYDVIKNLLALQIRLTATGLGMIDRQVDLAEDLAAICRGELEKVGVREPAQDASPSQVAGNDSAGDGPTLPTSPRQGRATPEGGAAS